MLDVGYTERVTHLQYKVYMLYSIYAILPRASDDSDISAGRLPGLDGRAAARAAGPGGHTQATQSVVVTRATGNFKPSSVETCSA